MLGTVFSGAYRSDSASIFWTISKRSFAHSEAIGARSGAASFQDGGLRVSEQSGASLRLAG